MSPSRRRARHTETRSHVQALLSAAGVNWPAFQRALGCSLRAQRKVRAFTQEALAERLGISAPWVGMLETGRGSPSLEMIALFARGLDSSVSDLLWDASAAIGGAPTTSDAQAELIAVLRRLPPATAEAVVRSVLDLCRALTQEELEEVEAR